MKKNNILVFGAFGYKENRLSGQTIKTRNVYEMLKCCCMDSNVYYFDTQDLSYSIINIFDMIKKLFVCDTIIYLPAQKNLKYLFPFLFLITRIRKVPIIYLVIGSWLSDYIKNKKIHIVFLSKIKKIYTETNTLKKRLEDEYKFKNVEVLHNFRINNYVPNISDNNPNELYLVFMSRINKLKGYTTIFDLAKYIDKNNLNIYIDFYGPIHSPDKEDFLNEVYKYDFIKYKGVIEPQDINSTLSKYDVLLLPTQYYTEGLPGAIVDAYISGVPVIVTNWMNAHEFVENGSTGFIVPFKNNLQQFIDCVLELYNDRNMLKEFKINAFNKSKEFSMDKAWKKLSKHFI